MYPRTNIWTRARFEFCLRVKHDRKSRRCMRRDEASVLLRSTARVQSCSSVVLLACTTSAKPHRCLSSCGIDSSMRAGPAHSHYHARASTAIFPAIFIRSLGISRCPALRVTCALVLSMTVCRAAIVSASPSHCRRVARARFPSFSEEEDPACLFLVLLVIRLCQLIALIVYIVLEIISLLSPGRLQDCTIFEHFYSEKGREREREREIVSKMFARYKKKTKFCSSIASNSPVPTRLRRPGNYFFIIVRSTRLHDFWTFLFGEREREREIVSKMFAHYKRKVIKIFFRIFNASNVYIYPNITAKYHIYMICMYKWDTHEYSISSLRNYVQGNMSSYPSYSHNVVSNEHKHM